MFLSLDGTFWIQLISFGVFLLALDRLFLKPVGSAIKLRRAYIDGVKADLEKYESEVAQLSGEAAQQRGAARRAADERILKARGEAEVKAAAIGADATARAQALVAESHAIVATEVATARVGEDDRARELAGVLLARASRTGDVAVSDTFYENYAIGSEVVAAVLFVVGIVVIWVRFIAPAVLAAREKKNQDLAEIERRRDDAKARVDAAKLETQNAGRDVVEIGARADRDAASIAERIVVDAEAEGRRMQRAAEGELERSRLAARAALKAKIVNKAVAIARENAAKLDDATDRRLVYGATDEGIR